MKKYGLLILVAVMMIIIFAAVKRLQQKPPPELQKALSIDQTENLTNLPQAVEQKVKKAADQADDRIKRALEDLEN